MASPPTPMTIDDNTDMLVLTAGQRVEVWYVLVGRMVPQLSSSATERGATTQRHSCGCLQRTRAAPLRMGATGECIWCG
jgi:hypothetical protein